MRGNNATKVASNATPPALSTTLGYTNKDFTMLLLNRLNQIQDQINAYLEEIAALQAKVTNLQAHAQEVQGVEQAAESALAQIDTALSMLSAVCPDEIATFKAAIDAKFRSLPVLGGAPQNTASNSTEAVETVEATVEVVAMTTEDEPSAEVTVVVDDSLAEKTDDAPNHESAATDNNNSDDSGNGDSNGHGNGFLMTIDQLKKVDVATLRKLAQAQGHPNVNTTKRNDLASMLAGSVTPDEVARMKNGNS